MVTRNHVYSPLNVIWSDCCWQLRRRDPYGEEGCSSLLLCTLVRTLQGNRRFNLYINFAYKRQNGWTDRAQIFCETSRDPREGLWMIKISTICLQQNSIFINFENLWNFFLMKSANFYLFCFTMYTVHKENKFTIEIEDVSLVY